MPRPLSRRLLLTVLLLGLIGLGLWVKRYIAEQQYTDVFWEPHGFTVGSTREDQNREQGPGASASAPPMSRVAVDPKNVFIARWQDLYADDELRQRIRGPRKKLLEEMRRTLVPLPYEEALHRLAAAGVVPAPPKDAFGDLLLEEMDHARFMLENQVESLSRYPASKVQDWRDREAQSIGSQSLDYAPEVLAAYFLGRDVTAEPSWSEELVSRLAEVRVRSLRDHAQAWEEYQYVLSCSFNASLESGFTLAPGQMVEDTAKFIPEARAVVDHVRASHTDYLRDVRDALIAAFPGEVF